MTEIEQLRAELESLKRIINEDKKNFSSRLVSYKSIEITGGGRLKLQNLSSNPTSGRVGELVVVGGKLKICTVASTTSPTWTTVGTQT
jgi:hypothetical protein